MKNKFFPRWKSVNDVLNAFIDSHFGIYLHMPTEEIAYVTFLPGDKLEGICPAEAAPALNERARIFTEHMIRVLKKHKMLKNIPSKYSRDEKERIIRLRFESFFVLYESIYGKSVLVKLKEDLGLRVKYDKLCEPKINPHLLADYSKTEFCKFQALLAIWRYPTRTIKRVFNVFQGSFDMAHAYLEFMASEDYKYPDEAWEAWTLLHNVPEDIGLDNPFKYQ